MAMKKFPKNFWGNLLELAKHTKPPLWQRFQKDRLVQPDAQYLVANSLSNNPNDERKLVQLL